MTDGPFGSNLKSSHYTESGARVIRLQNIGDGQYVDEKAFISLDHFESLRKHEICKGDLAIASLGNELPRACLMPELPEPAIVKADCIRMRVHPAVDNRWVLYALLAPETRKYAADRIRGVGRPRLGLNEIRQLPVPVPPAEEQRRIVAALEEQLSRLSVARATLENSLAKAKSMRRKVIGNLTSSSDRSWKTYTLGGLAKSVRNGLYVSRPGVEPDGVGILRIGAVRPLRLDLSDLRYSGLSEKQVSDSDYLLMGGDLLFTRYNGNPSYVGSCAVVPDGTGVLTYPDKLIRVRLDRSVADPEFVALACVDGNARKFIQESVKTTAGQAGIAGKDLKRVVLKLPPLEEQQARTIQYRVWDERISRLEQAVTDSRQKAVTLRRSLLAEAFAGRLARQDPDDEPADVLLTRIRADRAAVPQRRRARRSTPAQRKASDQPAPAATPTAPITGEQTAAFDLEMPS